MCFFLCDRFFKYGKAPSGGCFTSLGDSKKRTERGSQEAAGFWREFPHQDIKVSQMRKVCRMEGCRRFEESTEKEFPYPLWGYLKHVTGGTT